MGVFASKESVSQSNVFESDLTEINNIVNHLINSNNVYKNNEYNFFLKKKCNEFTIINSKKLNKYTKYELNSIDESLFLIPNDEVKKTKRILCNKISIHLTRILQLIYCIKYVYDLENNGDNSLGGIIMRNIKTNEDLIKVSTCESFQTDIYQFQKGVNFSMLSGFDKFVKFILTEQEAVTFLKQMEIILDTYDKKKLNKYVCKDLIIENKTHSKIHKSLFTCNQKGGKELYISNDDIFIKVNVNNPILNWNLCAFSKTYIAKNVKQLNTILKEMKSNYRHNFKKITELLRLLVYYDNPSSTYKLLNVSHEELSGIEQKIKRTIIIFFMQSLADYKNLLNTIKIYSINNE